MSKTQWRRSDKIALASLVFTVLTFIAAYVWPEVRSHWGLNDLAFSPENIVLFANYMYNHPGETIAIALLIASIGWVLWLLGGILIMAVKAMPDCIVRMARIITEDTISPRGSDTLEEYQTKTELSNRSKYREEIDPSEPYKVKVGKRHKVLREKYLKLNPRDMANFYGFELVSQLEKYENGDEEFTPAMLKKLCVISFLLMRNFLKRITPICSNSLTSIRMSPSN